MEPALLSTNALGILLMLVLLIAVPLLALAILAGAAEYVRQGAEEELAAMAEAGEFDEPVGEFDESVSEFDESVGEQRTGEPIDGADGAEAPASESVDDADGADRQESDTP